MSEFSDIRPFDDCEVSDVLIHLKNNPTMLKLLQFGFPKLSEEEQLQKLLSCKKIRNFQERIMYPIIQNAIAKSVTEFTSEGFENLSKDKAYLFISNHRDIILDTSFLNTILYEKGFKMTASAIGDNLVRKSFLLALAKLNRNFLIHRGLSPRETLEKSKVVSKFIARSIIKKNRSIWIAQREGRTKDGNDRTQQGVIKMLSMNCPKEISLMQYFKQLNIVPMAISYELDPTDILKMPVLIAEHYGEQYIKSEDEDFNNIVQGFVGQKGRVNVCVGKPLYDELDQIEQQEVHINKQIQAVVDLIDKRIHQQYHLFPTNYIVYSILNQTDKYTSEFSEREFRQFERRMENRSSVSEVIRKKYLEMYANPVHNRLIL